ncbi:transcriptional regulator [Vagococcus penaei]|uniref:Transcriptional regulator n=1 Tax=Vagococcus penaei TaxID=633807 RepID=A0A1Q2D8X4_9ENTE|nr:winged helix-turn-helix domain-containing protein [Vagococcus penaei]AQP54653.1 transcriptional regulator [Vagococcus penaei]RSU05305.1 transcriptional regulator [Vagococcus penaei]
MTTQDQYDCLTELTEAIDFDFYKTLFDPVRIEIIQYLAVHGKSNITEIAEHLPQDRSVISRHLDLMHRYHLVAREKQGRQVLYDVNSQAIFNQFTETTNQLGSLISPS